MSENKKIIQNVYDMIIKFNNIEGNQYDILSFNFRDILSREKFGFEYNFLPFMFRNLELFKKYLDDVLTLEQLKDTIREDGWPDISINGYLDNLHKVTLTYDKLYEICFTNPNKIESAIENLFKNFSEDELELISFRLMEWKHTQKRKKK